MKKRLSLASAMAIMLLLVTAFSVNPIQAGETKLYYGKIVVANRGSGDISVLDARTGSLYKTIDLPQAKGEAFPEPMYVVYTLAKDQFFVGDRANNRVVAFDADDFRVLGTVPVGAGVFHMWADLWGRQLWVNNDVDKTTTVFSPRTMKVLKTIPTPMDLVAQGGKPHDVILDPNGRYAYLSIVNVSGADDYVLKFSTATFEELGRVAVGKDPHLSLNNYNDLLYVPTQGNNAVYLINRVNMKVVKMLDVPGAHGAGMAYNGRHFYTTNISGGGKEGIYTIDTLYNQVVGEPVDAPYANPHNIALGLFSDRLFLTHSGANADKVSFYKLRGKDQIPVFWGEATVGLNPFGISYVPY